MTRIHTLKVKWLYSGLFIAFSWFTFGQDLSMVFVGDVMQHDGQIEAAYNAANQTYDYDDGFKFVKPILEEYDLRVANLEVTLAGKPYKGYPQFSAPDELAETLVRSGFNVILTANNHSCDRGANGVVRTLDQLDQLGVAHTGTFRNSEEREKNYPLMIEKKGIKVAMLNYTYGTNGLEVPAPLIINYIDSTVIKEDVAKAKRLGADYIVCTMHWGTEYKFLPNSYQKTYEQLCYRLGVDMVIGGHPHVVQPIEKKAVNGREVLTVWSLGNFVSNMQTRPTRGGLMVGATIKKEGGQVLLGDVDYRLVYVLKRKEGAVTQYYILPEFDYNLYRSDFMDQTNSTRANDFFSDSRKLFSEHNKDCSELLVTKDSEAGKLYEKYLTQYYSVRIDDPDYKVLMDEHVGDYFHLFVDQQGSRCLLSGVCDSKTQAEGVRNFVRDLNLSESISIVQVTPEQIKVVE